MLLTIVSFIFVLGIVVFFHELGHFLAAKAFGVRVHRFSLGFPPKMVGFKKGETEYCISWIPLGGYVKMEGENPAESDDEEVKNDPGNLLYKPAWQRAIIFFAGPFANYITAILIAIGLFYFIGSVVVDPDKFVVGNVVSDSPADEVGLRPGDIIVSVDNSPITTLTDLHEQVFNNIDKNLSIVWERNGSLTSSIITPRKDTATNAQGDIVEHGMIGIWQQADTVPMGLGQAFVKAHQATWNVSVMMVTFLKKWVTGEVSRKLIGGPIAIAKFSGQKAREGFSSLMDFVVLISLNLAILNLLPIPVLDGGHLFLLLIEVVRRKPLSLKQKLVVQQIGLAVLLVMIVFVTYNDIFGNLLK